MLGHRVCTIILNAQAVSQRRKGGREEFPLLCGFCSHSLWRWSTFSSSDWSYQRTCDFLWKFTLRFFKKTKKTICVTINLQSLKSNLSLASDLVKIPWTHFLPSLSCYKGRNLSLLVSGCYWKTNRSYSDTICHAAAVENQGHKSNYKKFAKTFFNI